MRKVNTVWLNRSQMEALAGARTQEIWECFDSEQCLAASEVQQRLGLESKTVYYQLAKLERVGLLLPCATDRRAATYRRAAKYVRMPHGYQGAKYEAIAARMLSARLRKTIRNVQRAAKQTPKDPSLVDYMYSLTGRLELPASELKDFTEKLRRLLLQFNARSKQSTGRRIRTIFVITPELD